ncbi:MAG: hypothetical protein AB1331_01975 [Bacillota bacterium]
MVPSTRGLFGITLLNSLVSSVGAFLAASRAVLIPHLAGEEDLLKANALLGAIYGGCLLFAPTIVGVAIMRIGPNWAFAINSLSYRLPALAMFIVRPVAALPSSEPIAGSDRGIGAALRCIMQSPAFLLMLGLFAIYELEMWAVNALYYPCVCDVLGAGTDVMGYSISTYFGVFLLVAAALARWGDHLKRASLLPVGAVLGALVWVGYTLLVQPGMRSPLSWDSCPEVPWPWWLRSTGGFAGRVLPPWR